MNYEIKEAIEKLESMLYSKDMVMELCDVDMTDYARGVVYGRIEMLNRLRVELLGNDDEEDSEA